MRLIAMATQRWNRFFKVAYHEWTGWKMVRFVLKICLLASIISGIWYTLQRWLDLGATEAAAFGSAQFLQVAASYSALFFMINTACVVLYMVAMGWLVYVMSRFGCIQQMDFIKSCKLTLLTGIFLLLIMLMFAQMLGITLSAWGMMLLVLTHAAWLVNMDLSS